MVSSGGIGVGAVTERGTADAVDYQAMLRGNLAEFPLVGILQLLSKDKKTGTVRIQSQYTGRISVLNGAPVDAAYDAVRGERALSLLNSLPAAPFEFDGDTKPTATTIQRPTHELLLMLYDQRAQWFTLRQRLGDWGFEPHWLSRPSKFGSAEQAVMAELLGAQRSIERVLIDSQLEPLRAAEVLLEMSDLRMIALSPNNQMSAPQQLIVLSVYHTDTSIAFVDRGLHDAWAANLGPVSALVISPKGERQIFKLHARDNISDRIMIPDAALRKLRLVRGVKVTVIPTGAD